MPYALSYTPEVVLELIMPPVTRAQLARQRAAVAAAVAALNVVLVTAVTSVAQVLALAPSGAVVAGGRAAWAYERAPSWWATTAQHLSDEDFRSHFRVCWDTFHYIVDQVGESVEGKTTRWRAALAKELVVACAIYRLATGHDYRTIGNLFGVSTSVAQACLVKVVNALSPPSMLSLLAISDFLLASLSYDRAQSTSRTL